METEIEQNLEPGIGPRNIRDPIQDVDVDVIIKELQGDLHLVEEWFDEIHTRIRELDAQNYTGRESVPRFEQDWGKIRKNFKDLVWMSRRVATTGAVHARLYLKLILPLVHNEKILPADKEKKITKFVLAMGSSVAAAETMTEEFRQFPKQLDEFRGRISVVRTKIGDPPKDKEQHQLLKREIESLRQSVDGCKASAKWDWGLTTSGSSITGASGLGVYYYTLGTLLGAGLVVPLLAGAVGTGMKGYALHKTYKTLSVLQKDLKSKILELKQLGGEENYYTIEASVQGLLELVSDVCSRLGAIGDIWGSIRLNMQSMQDTIPVLDPDPDESYWNSHVSTTFKKLEDVLIVYANHH